MSALENILQRLDRVRQVGPGRFMAGCPICNSRKGRPVSVGENGDGAVLLHGFCGCSTESLLGSLGLTLADLYDKPIGHCVASNPNRVSARDLLAVASEDADLVGVIAADMLAHREISERDWKSLASAVARLGEIRRHVES